MAKYRAIVSITFDDGDLTDLAESLGVDPDRMDAHNTLSGALDNLELGSGWIEQLFKNGRPTIGRLSGGITVEVNPHEPA